MQEKTAAAILKKPRWIKVTLWSLGAVARLPQDPRSWYADPAETLARARRLTPRVVLRHDYKPNDFALWLRHGAPGEAG